MQSHNSSMCVVFSNVSFHMSSQIVCLYRCKVTMVADIPNFAIKWFQKSSQVAWLNRCKVIIVACVCFSQMRVIFSGVSFHVSSQIACLKRCKVTIFACVWFSQMLVFTCLLKSPAWIDAKSQELQVVLAFKIFFLAKSVFLKIWMFDFYALKVCTKESMCCYFQGSFQSRHFHFS